MIANLVTAHVKYRSPYRFGELLGFFRARALQGVEIVEDDAYLRAVRLIGVDGAIAEGCVRVEDDPSGNRLLVTVSDELAPCMPQVVARVRRMFDVQCDPITVASGLSALENTVPGTVRVGTRLPGCFDPFETACRAVLGQQVSVAAAGKLAARIVEAYGTEVDTGIAGLARVWPAPADVLALGSAEDAFGQLGVIKSRSRTIAEIARLLEAKELDFNPGTIATEQMERLLAIKGIGPWTANYIAMRALSYPDAFLESDVGVAHALPNLTPKQRMALAESWRPWRSYAVISLWNSLENG